MKQSSYKFVGQSWCKFGSFLRLYLHVAHGGIILQNILSVKKKCYRREKKKTYMLRLLAPLHVGIVGCNLHVEIVGSLSLLKEGLAANSFEVMLQTHNVFQHGTLQVLDAIKKTKNEKLSSFEICRKLRLQLRVVF